MTRALILATMLLTSCSGQWLSRMYEKEAIERFNYGMYIKDNRTGLCFFILDGYRTSNAACVPCEALEDVKVLLYYPQKVKQ